MDAILKWLDPTDFEDPSSEYRRHLSSQAPQTGLWVRSAPQYAQWHDTDPCGAIWVKAVAGAGKSVLAASVIDHLRSVEDAVVCFFFFRHIVDANRGPRALLRDLLAQLLHVSPVLQASLHAFSETNRSVESASTKQLWNLLLAGLRAVPKVYVVIDGLDEMTLDASDDHDFLAALNTLGAIKPATIKVMLTGRPEQHLQHALRDPKLIHIDLERDLVNSDITLFIQHRIRTWNIDRETSARLKENIVSRASGLFLYARLMLDQLQDHLTAEPLGADALQNLIQALPIGLEDMYNSLLRKHAEKAGVTEQMQVDIFDCITHAARPLRLLELADALRLLDVDHEITTSEYKALIRSSCGPLIEIMEDGTVQVLHHSLTEFLHAARPNDRDTTRLAQFPSLDALNSHSRLATVCLKHVLSGVLGPSDARIPSKAIDTLRKWYHDNEDTLTDREPLQFCIGDEGKSHVDDFDLTATLLEHPLLQYACIHWPYHVRLSSSRMVDHFPTLDQFLRPESLIMAHWTESQAKNSAECPLEVGAHALHVAARLGLLPYAEHRLQKGDAVDELDCLSNTPMMHASVSGHAQIISLLLRHGANAEAENCKQFHCFEFASSHGHVEAAKIFLDMGLPPEGSAAAAIATVSLVKFHWPIAGAVKGNHRSVVLAMIPFLTTSAMQWALCHAAELGYSEIVQDFLRQPGVSANEFSPYVNLETSLRETPLCLAASSGNSETVAVLLKAGADVHKLSEQYLRNMGRKRVLGRTPLHKWASATSQKSLESVTAIFGLLRDAGCDVNARDSAGNTALLLSQFKHATYNNDPHLASNAAELLLAAGADVNARGISGRTALHEAAARPQTGPTASAISVLCKWGADPNARCDRQRTPMHETAIALQAGNIQLLHAQGASLDAADFLGATALHLAVLVPRGSQIVERLLKAGADIDAKDRKGRSPLFYASEETLKALIDNGADLHLRDVYGRTPFLQAVRNGEEKCARKLVEAGASPTAVDDDGSSALHHCGASKMTKKLNLVAMFNFLMSLGIDEQQVNRAGRSAVHAIASTYRTPEDAQVLARLIEMGLHPDSKDEDGRTPLSLASSVLPILTGSNRQAMTRPLVEVLAESGCIYNVNSVDDSGWSPLMHAATSVEGRFDILLRHGANAQVVNRDGQTVLHVAARARQANSLHLALMQLGSGESLRRFVALQDSKGRTALHEACRSGIWESSKMLVDANMETIHLRDSAGRTPLHACAEFMEEQSIWSGLRERKQSNFDRSRPWPLEKDVADIDYHTVFFRPYREILTRDRDCAHVKNIAEYLCDSGASTASGDNEGRTPLQLAELLKCKGVIDTLTSPTTQESLMKADITTSLDDLFDEMLRSNPPRLDKFLDSASFLQCLSQSAPALSAIALSSNRSALMVFASQGLGDWIAAVPTEHVRDHQQMAEAQLFSKAEKDRPRMLTMPRPLLHEVCSRTKYSMSLVRLLVEHFQVDVNDKWVCYARLDLPKGSGDLRDDYKVSTLTSIMHVLALGKSHWHLEALIYLAGRGSEVDARNGHDVTPLMNACCHDSARGVPFGLERVRALIELGADVNAVDKDGESCLSRCISDPELTKLLTEAGASSDIHMELNGRFCEAILEGSPESIESLLKAGANANQVDVDPDIYEYGLTAEESVMTPLAYFCEMLNKEDPLEVRRIVELLLQYGADLQKPFLENDLILHHLLRSGHAAAAAAVVDIGEFDINLRNPKGETLLHAAAHNRTNLGRPETFEDGPDSLVALRCLENLPDARSSIDYQAEDNEGNNVLHKVGTAALEHLIKLPAAAGLLDRVNNAGVTPIRASIHKLANRRIRVETVQAFIKHGADLTIAGKDGQTILHDLPRLMSQNLWKKEDVTHMFESGLKAGVPIDARDADGNTPLFIFLRDTTLMFSGLQEFNERVEGLYRDADFKAVNNMGETMLHAITQRKVDFDGAARFGQAASRDHCKDAFSAIMARGVDPLQEDNQGRTAVDVGSVNGHSYLTELLKRHKE